MKRIMMLLSVFMFFIYLSGCNMIAPDEAVFEKYCEQNPTDEGCIDEGIPTGVRDDDNESCSSGYILQGNDCVLVIDDPDTSNTDDDPYRKYDDGVINYNYDEMTWVTNGSRTYYVKKDTEVLHGMYFSTLDGVVDDDIVGIIYYFEGEVIRDVEYFDYPLIESDRRYFDIWTDEYFYYNDSEQVSQYYKREYIDDEWMEVERIIYNENGTISITKNYSLQGRIIKSYDQNGMLTYELDIEYPRISVYSYFENGAVSSMLEGTINTDNYTYEDFVDHQYSDAPYYLYSDAIYEEYRSPGVLEESGTYGVLTLFKREYNENGVLTNEKEVEFISGNSPMWVVDRVYVDGELYSESCWDADTYYYCDDE